MLGYIACLIWWVPATGSCLEWICCGRGAAENVGVRLRGGDIRETCRALHTSEKGRNEDSIESIVSKAAELERGNNSRLVVGG